MDIAIAAGDVSNFLVAAVIPVRHGRLAEALPRMLRSAKRCAADPGPPKTTK
jgi:hypothetical protein